MTTYNEIEYDEMEPFEKYELCDKRYKKKVRELLLDMLKLEKAIYKLLQPKGQQAAEVSIPVLIEKICDECPQFDHLTNDKSRARKELCSKDHQDDTDSAIQSAYAALYPANPIETIPSIFDDLDKLIILGELLC